MGLDWNPGPKAKPGQKTEFDLLWRQLHGKWCWWRKAKIKRFEAITVTPFDTLAVPTVGIDNIATQWAIQKYPARTNKALSEEQFLESLKGFRVLELVPSCDGLPRYTNGIPGSYIEAFSFRAQWLISCADILNDELLEKAYQSMLPEDTVIYGQRLIELATNFASEKKINLSQNFLSEDPESTEYQLDVIQSAGRWCVFWGERGHWLEAYF
jgi:hypothetical protein